MVTKSIGRILGLAAATVVASGCSSECVTTRTFFVREVWGKYMGTTCLKCHVTEGLAQSRGAKFTLQPSTYPGFLDENLRSIKDYAKTEYDGTPLILLKPLGERGHEGSKVLDEGSDDYASLVSLLDRLDATDSCTDDETETPRSHVRTLDAPATLRKAALHLNGRLPTDGELATLKKDGDAALGPAIEALTQEPAFLDRLMELWNDVLLTDKYRWRGYPNALGELNGDEFPGAKKLREDWDRDRWAGYTEEEKRLQNDALGRQPLNLIRYVVQNDLPMTEIIAADYVVADDFLAKVFDIKDGKTGVRKAELKHADGTVVPQAGILSMPMFLNRYPTTPTNRSRGRARVLLKNFLATDILKLADRPVDVAKVTAQDNPTMNAAQCTVCHKLIDPIAGGFRAYDERDYERYDAGREWHSDMVHPGFGAEQTPAKDYGAALGWLARQMTNDPRFDIAMVRFAYTAITARSLLPFPTDGVDRDSLVRAWDAQQQELEAYRVAFVDGGRRFRPLVKAVVLGQTYRAFDAPGADAATLAELETVGTARLVSPEVLNRKIIATTGIHWRMPWDWDNQHDWLLDGGVNQLYGGIDSEDVTERPTSINGVMSNLVWRMASETACMAVPYEFSISEDKRVLFPKVRQTDVPESAGFEVPGSVGRIKDNIRHLYGRLLGETPTEVEVARAYQLFLDTWREGNGTGAVDSWLEYPCGLNPVTGKNVQDAVRRDETFTIRAWTAVVTYLLSDYRFLYE